jgi:hypothetical protein
VVSDTSDLFCTFRSQSQTTLEKDSQVPRTAFSGMLCPGLTGKQSRAQAWTRAQTGICFVSRQQVHRESPVAALFNTSTTYVSFQCILLIFNICMHSCPVSGACCPAWKHNNNTQNKPGRDVCSL